MGKKGLGFLGLVLCFGPPLIGCPKKTVVKEEPSVKREEGVAKLTFCKNSKDTACSLQKYIIHLIFFSPSLQ